LHDMNPEQVAEVRRQLVAFATRSVAKPAMAKAQLPAAPAQVAPPGVVLPYKVPVRRTLAKATLRIAPQRRAIAAAR